MTDEVYYIVEPVAQSRETDRDDLTNHHVITVPVIGGPYDDFDEAVNKAGSDGIVVTNHE